MTIFNRGNGRAINTISIIQVFLGEGCTQDLGF